MKIKTLVNKYEVKMVDTRNIIYDRYKGNMATSTLKEGKKTMSNECLTQDDMRTRSTVVINQGIYEIYTNELDKSIYTNEVQNCTYTNEARSCVHDEKESLNKKRNKYSNSPFNFNDLQPSAPILTNFTTYNASPYKQM